jgi:hypothetical protein
MTEVNTDLTAIRLTLALVLAMLATATERDAVDSLRAYRRALDFSLVGHDEEVKSAVRDALDTIFSDASGLAAEMG